MKPVILVGLYCTCLLFLVTSCKKHSHESGTGSSVDADVFVLGTQGNEAILWKNGNPSKIDDQTAISYNFNSSSLAVSNGNVYISGTRAGFNGSIRTGIPMYWFNGMAKPLDNASDNATDNAIAVSGSDIYEAGVTVYPDTSHVLYTTPNASYPQAGPRTTVWKNGAPTSLPGSYALGMVAGNTYTVQGYEDYVSGMYVSGNDVYVSGGSFYTFAHASYWKNNARIDLGAGPLTTTGIAVSGNDVYVTGFASTSQVGTLGVYWKNGELHYLSTDSTHGSSSATAVVVANGDVYIAGWQNIDSYSRAMLWKNGVGTPLTNGTLSSSAYSVYVVGADVYVAGTQWVAPGNYVAVYWKNGVPVTLTDPSVSAIAFSIKAEPK